MRNAGNSDNDMLYRLDDISTEEDEFEHQNAQGANKKNKGLAND